MKMEKKIVLPLLAVLTLITATASRADEYSSTITATRRLVDANYEVMTDARVTEALRKSAAKAIVEIAGWAHVDRVGIPADTESKDREARTLLGIRDRDLNPHSLR